MQLVPYNGENHDQAGQLQMFYSFDGVDGTGKTTQVELFCDWLRELGQDVVSCRDPGSTQLGETIRKMLLDDFATPIHRRSEMLLYMAARAQMVEEIIRPALSENRTVVTDRFLLANVVYQAHAGGLDVQQTWQVGHVATGGIQPDMVFLLDMPADKAADRIPRSMDRMESQGLTYLEQVRQGFLNEADQHPEQIIVIDADQDIRDVQNAIRFSCGIENSRKGT